MDGRNQRILGPYALYEVIGRGAMGTVFRGMHLGLQQPRAIKILHPHLAWQEEFVRRFQREAVTAAGLNHPNIVPIYDVGNMDDIRYLAMKLVAGESLRRFLDRNGPLPFARVLHILSQLASALDYAHAQGVIHRDLKAGNVLVDAEGTVTLVDFGIARALEGAPITTAGALIGTPEYLAPEVIGGRPYSRSSDHYALGIVAYELLTGRPPFAGRTMQVLHAQVEALPPPLRRVRPDLSAAAEAVVLRQLAKDPVHRYPSAGEFTRTLATAFQLAGALARVGNEATEVPAPGPTPGAGAGAPPPAPQPVTRWWQRSAHLVWATGIGAALAFGGLSALTLLLAMRNGWLPALAAGAVQATAAASAKPASTLTTGTATPPVTPSISPTPAGSPTPAPLQPVWQAVGGLRTARTSGALVRLENGTPLFIGGTATADGQTPLASSEWFDLDRGVWQAAAALANSLREHVATPLADGRVLVTGGIVPIAVVASAEIFDPTSGVWTESDGMAVARYGHTATLLADGRVLVVGGTNERAENNTLVEIYDPAIGAWTPAGAMRVGRRHHTATLLPSGQVLIAGGEDSDDNPLASYEIFDPFGGGWSSAGNLMAARRHHTATLLPTGEVVLAGGYGAGAALVTTEIYSPVVNAWRAGPPLIAARHDHQATLLPGGLLLLTGGRADAMTYLASAEIFDPAQNRWLPAGTMATPRAHHGAVLLADGRVLVAGGVNGRNQALAETEIFGLR